MVATRGKQQAAPRTTRKSESGNSRAKRQGEGKQGVTVGASAVHPQRRREAELIWAGAAAHRVKLLLERPIDYVADATFETDAAAELLECLDDVVGAEPPREASAGSERAVTEAEADACRVLSKHEETWLFRRMNYLKFLAARVCRSLARRPKRLERIAWAEELLREALAARDRLIRANMRLVVSIVKQYAGRSIAYDELLSEAHLTLIQAIEKFDVSRGFKFSTYATRSIQNNLNHFVQRQRRRSQRVVAGGDLVLQAVPDHRGTTRQREQAALRAHEAVATMLSRLDDEKRAILEARFGLEGDGARLSLKRIGEERGMSRERVRQIQTRALRELRSYADELQLEPPDELD